MINFNKMINFLKRLGKNFDNPPKKIIYNFILMFTFMIIYKIINMIDENSFSSKLNNIDTLYFTIMTQMTVGYGEIVPKSQLAKMLVMIHTTLFWMIVIF